MLNDAKAFIALGPCGHAAFSNRTPSASNGD